MSVCVFLQARSYKLVSDAGIIRPEVFYKALTVWIDRDVLGYAFSQVCNKATYPLEIDNHRKPCNMNTKKLPIALFLTMLLRDQLVVESKAND